VHVALLGNPNAGKTTLFNALTGLRAKTANFPGTTIEKRSAHIRLAGRTVELLDLPGIYSLNSATPEERLTHEALEGRLGSGGEKPDAAVLLVDATHLERNLYLASQALELGLPMVVALNMVDLAEQSGAAPDAEQLSVELGCPVIPVVARNGRGVEALRQELERLVAGVSKTQRFEPPASLCNCTGCPHQARYDWAEAVGGRCSTGKPRTQGARTEKIDRVVTHPVVGVVVFQAVMIAVFATIFWLAQYPMGWIEQGFGVAASIAGKLVSQPDLHDLLVNGIIGGVGGILVFLPQICILFFLLALLEDTGYFARAAFVMDRLMRRVGLPGKAFVPMLSAHACAVPAIMATRVIEDRRERLITILVLPMLTCSARIPVFAMLTALLFPHQPMLAALVFTGAYGLGLVATLVVAFALKRTVLPGETQPLIIELPGYKLPNLRNAWMTMLDRALVFVKTAGTIILLLSMILWALASYPKSDAPPEATALLAQADRVETSGAIEQADALRTEASKITEQHALSRSVAGRLGHLIEPAIRPLGYDWQIGIGLISSFAAREVIVSTLAIVYGVGEDAVGNDPKPLYDRLRAATRSDGTPVYTPATNVSLLVFYVLAMQCISTLAITKRETNSWRWPLFQLAFMTVLAYGSALVAFQVMSAVGFG